MTDLPLGHALDGEEVVGAYLPESERDSHLYVIGATGVGKSKALARWIISDIHAGAGVGVLDPHGDLVTDVLAYVHETDSIRLIEFGDEELVTLNPLEPLPRVPAFRQALDIVDVFRKVWQLSDEGSPRLLEILRNSIITLIEAGETLLELEPLLTDATYRTQLTRDLANETAASFWRNRFERWPEKDRINNVESTLNKVSTFLADPLLRLVLGAKKSTIDFREVMDRGQTVLVNLSKGDLGGNANLIGALLMSRIQMAAVGRLKAPPESRTPWTLYVDEFQNFATDSFAEALAEARKMGLRLVLAHQTLAQLPEYLRATVLGNSKSLVTFRVDRLDAELLARYIHDVDPGAIKYFLGPDFHFEGLDEQWERFISELAGLPERVAFVRVKGQSFPAQVFWTTDLPTNRPASEDGRAAIRRAGCAAGWLRPASELAAELKARAEARVSDSDEPSDFWDSPRGSD